MNAFTRIVALAVLIAIGAWVWITFFPSPERVIRKRLDALAHDASFSPNEGIIPRVARAQALVGFFTTNVEVKLDIPGLRDRTLVSRDDIQQAASAEHAGGGGVDAKFSDINILVGNDKTTAMADLTLVARVSGQTELIVQDLKITFTKVDGKWLIRRIETVRPLSSIGSSRFAFMLAQQALHWRSWLGKNLQISNHPNTV